MRVVGIDQGMSSTGFAILDVDEHGQGALIRYGCVPLNTRQGVVALAEILNDQPAGTHYATEMRWTGTRKGRTDAEARYIVKGQSEALGIIRVLMLQAGIAPLKPVAPSSGKLALAGLGSATKEAMISAARMRYGMDADPNEHEADAMGIALAAGRRTLMEKRKRQQELFDPATGKPRRRAR